VIWRKPCNVKSTRSRSSRTASLPRRENHPLLQDIIKTNSRSLKTGETRKWGSELGGLGMEIDIVSAPSLGGESEVTFTPSSRTTDNFESVFKWFSLVPGTEEEVEVTISPSSKTGETRKWGSELGGLGMEIDLVSAPSLELSSLFPAPFVDTMVSRWVL
jgi:hypothetical protein